MFSFTLLLLFTFTANQCNSVTTVYKHHVFYWPLWPYINQSSAGYHKANGIFPDVVQKLFSYCKRTLDSEFIFYPAFKNQEEYFDFMKTNFSRGKGILKDVPMSDDYDYLWFAPLLSPEIEDAHHMWINNAMRAVEASGAHVVVRRSLVSWKYKMLQGVQNSLNYLILAILMSFSVGTIVYLLETHPNNEYGDSLPEGVWNGFWWSTVTMTTIGYGDIVPKSVLARLFSLFWLIFGILMGSVITATVTDAMAGTEYLEIQQKVVAVLKNSWEKRIAEEYNAKVIEKKSYEEVLDAVRNEEVFAALVNSDIIRWKQDSLREGAHPLAIAYKINIEIPIRANVIIKGVDTMWDCLQRYRTDIIDTPVRKYFRHITVDTVHYVSLKEMLIDDWLGLILFSMSLTIILICLAWFFMEKYVFKQKMNVNEIMKWLKGKSDKRTDTMELNGNLMETDAHHTNEPKRRHSRLSDNSNRYSIDTRHFHGIHNPNNSDSLLSVRVKKIEENVHEIKTILNDLVKKPSKARKISASLFKGKDLSGALM